jgi:SsrA-binding protein
MEKQKNNKVSIQNRKASFEYNFIEKFEAGIVLIGAEVKSIRENGANISDAYCYVNGGEMFIKNMHISHLKNTKAEEQHEPLRERKLLLNKKEIRKISNELKNQGLTVVPISLYTNDRGRMKINIALSKGKKLFDKRDSLKEKYNKRETDRALKGI